MCQNGHDPDQDVNPRHEGKTDYGLWLRGDPPRGPRGNGHPRKKG